MKLAKYLLIHRFQFNYKHGIINILHISEECRASQRSRTTIPGVEYCSIAHMALKDGII